MKTNGFCSNSQCCWKVLRPAKKSPSHKTYNTTYSSCIPTHLANCFFNPSQQFNIKCCSFLDWVENLLVHLVWGRPKNISTEITMKIIPFWISENSDKNWSFFFFFLHLVFHLEVWCREINIPCETRSWQN